MLKTCNLEMVLSDNDFFECMSSDKDILREICVETCPENMKGIFSGVEMMICDEEEEEQEQEKRGCVCYCTPPPAFPKRCRQCPGKVFLNFCPPAEMTSSEFLILILDDLKTKNEEKKCNKSDPSSETIKDDKKPKKKFDEEDGGKKVEVKVIRKKRKVDDNEAESKADVDKPEDEKIVKSFSKSEPLKNKSSMGNKKSGVRKKRIERTKSRSRPDKRYASKKSRLSIKPSSRKTRSKNEATQNNNKLLSTTSCDSPSHFNLEQQIYEQYGITVKKPQKKKLTFYQKIKRMFGIDPEIELEVKRIRGENMKPDRKMSRR